MSSKPSILFLLNDFNLGGANKLLISFCKWLNKNKNYTLIFVSTRDGLLKGDFSRLGETRISKFKNPSLFKKFRRKAIHSSLVIDELIESDIQFLLESNIKLIYANTIHNERVANCITKYIKSPLVVHVHEQPYIMELYDTPELRYHFSMATSFVTVSGTSGAGLNAIFNIDYDKIINIHPAVVAPDVTLKQINKFLLKEKLGLPENSFIVLGMGTPHWIKGVDLFTQTARRVIKANPLVHFIWVGGNEKNHYLSAQIRDAVQMGITSNVHFIPSVQDPQSYFNISDLFFLSSRVDTFPLVVLEASQFHLPVVCFKNAGGIIEIVDESCGSVVDYLDLPKASEEILFYSTKRDIVRMKGNFIFEKVKASFNHETMCLKLADFIDTHIKQS